MFELAVVGEEKEYSLAVELVRELVAGQVYENPVARLSHAPSGLLCEIRAPFLAVYAWLGSAVAEVLDEREARRVVWEALARAEEGGDLAVVYGEERHYLAGSVTAGRPRLEPPYCLVLRAGRERRWLFFTGREFLHFKLSHRLPVLAPLHE